MVGLVQLPYPLACLRSMHAGLLLLALFALGLTACGGGGTGASPAPPAPTPVSAPFNGSILLGSPTADSIRLKLLSPDQKGTAYISYGTVSGELNQKSVSVPVLAGEPAELTLQGLLAATRYFYRVQFAADGASASAGLEYSFVTARPADSTFTFTLQADSHLDENSDLDQYKRTLGNVLADKPDFHIDLGDTFMTEKHSDPLTALVQMASDLLTVKKRYAYERANFGLITQIGRAHV